MWHNLNPNWIGFTWFNFAYTLAAHGRQSTNHLLAPSPARAILGLLHCSGPYTIPPHIFRPPPSFSFSIMTSIPPPLTKWKPKVLQDDSSAIISLHSLLLCPAINPPLIFLLNRHTCWSACICALQECLTPQRTEEGMGCPATHCPLLEAAFHLASRIPHWPFSFCLSLLVPHPFKNVIHQDSDSGPLLFPIGLLVTLHDPVFYKSLWRVAHIYL